MLKGPQLCKKHILRQYLSLKYTKHKWSRALIAKNVVFTEHKFVPFCYQTHFFKFHFSLSTLLSPFFCFHNQAPSLQTIFPLDNLSPTNITSLRFFKLFSMTNGMLSKEILSGEGLKICIIISLKN